MSWARYMCFLERSSKAEILEWRARTDAKRARLAALDWKAFDEGRPRTHLAAWDQNEDFPTEGFDLALWELKEALLKNARARRDLDNRQSL